MSNRAVSVTGTTGMPSARPMGLTRTASNGFQATANRLDRKAFQVNADSPERIDCKVKLLLNKLTLEKFDSIPTRSSNGPMGLRTIRTAGR